MTDIPEDINRTAWELAPKDAPFTTVQVIALAILAERERCAQIAREYPFTGVFEAHKNHAVACNTSQNIADMIDGRLSSAIRSPERAGE